MSTTDNKVILLESTFEEARQLMTKKVLANMISKRDWLLQKAASQKSEFAAKTRANAERLNETINTIATFIEETERIIEAMSDIARNEYRIGYQTAKSELLPSRRDDKEMERARSIAKARAKWSNLYDRQSYVYHKQNQTIERYKRDINQ